MEEKVCFCQLTLIFCGELRWLKVQRSHPSSLDEIKIRSTPNIITAQGGITKWQRVRISSDGGTVAGRLGISRVVSYPEKSSMDTVMEKHIGKPKRKPQSAKQLWQMELPYRQPERKNRSPAIAWNGYIQRNARWKNRRILNTAPRSISTSFQSSVCATLWASRRNWWTISSKNCNSKMNWRQRRCMIF